MSQFYARYVPTAAAAPRSSPEPSKIEKRKRTTEEPSSKNRKRQKKVAGDDESQTAQTETSTGAQQRNQVVKADGVHTHTAVRSKTNASKDGASPQPVTEEGKTDAKFARKEKKKRKKERSPDSTVADEDYTKKHGGMLSKFNKALAERPAPLDHIEDTSVKEQGEMHGLEPIPQPEVVDLPVQRPSFSVLPGWQADAVRVVHRGAKMFSDFPIAKSTVKNLHKSGLEKSFPIQTTVLPLLLEGADHHDGDVCVSAATGSGKTLAYVLPMIEDLKEYADTSLRGVIVVPTRELVQQVRQLCETCAAGSKLKIAVASGSKSMSDEQRLLVVEEERYDPQRWEQEQNAPIDWANFSIATFMQEARHRSRPTSTHFVKQHRSKVDILITTPGRLVDHLRSTAGFNLDHVSWLVVDEADRLLNESYQEWIDVVTPALQSQVATAERDKLLRHMRMEPPPRQVKKVLLSATMTRDISKLSSLGLVNPKLVVLGHPPSESHVEESKPEEDGLFHLPPSLVELVVAIKDGHDKPLFLLEILQTRILASAGAAKTTANGTIPDDESDSSSSSSDSSSDSESDSDTDSDSEASVTSSDSSASETSQSHEKPSAFIKPSPKHPKTITTPSTTRVLIFTRSTASTTRLSRLLSLLSPSLASQISTLTKSTSSSASSRRALSSFRSGRTPILIATDRASRGLDIPNLEHVVSYDVPSSALTYVHRVGRTARAGNKGTAWTIVEHREGRWFWGEIGGKGKGKQGEQQGDAVQRTNKVQKIQVEVDVEAWKEAYEAALAKLGDEVKA